MSISRSRFAAIVDDAIDELPDWVVDRIDNLFVVVEDTPTAEQDPEGEGILGIYEGTSLADRGVDYFGTTPDRIVIFYGPHMELGLRDAELADEVRRTVLHEIAHHLGIDDERLHDLGWD